MSPSSLGPRLAVMNTFVIAVPSHKIPKKRQRLEVYFYFRGRIPADCLVQGISRNLLDIYETFKIDKSQERIKLEIKMFFFYIYREFNCGLIPQFLYKKNEQ